MGGLFHVHNFYEIKISNNLGPKLPITLSWLKVDHIRRFNNFIIEDRIPSIFFLPYVLEQD